MRERSLRRLFSVFLFLSIGAAGVNAPLYGQDKFPARPVEVIVGFAEGGGTDLMMRIIAEAVTPFLGQKMVIINKPGAGGVIGVGAVAKARPDGYTIGGVNPAALTMTPHISNVGYTLDDFRYITQLTTSPPVWCCNADFPAKDAREFFELARKNPGKLTYACDGIGGATHFYSELLFRTMNVKLRPVPFGGAGESIKALLGKHVDIYGGSVPPALPHVKTGAVRGFLSLTLEGVPELPGSVGVAALGHPEIAKVMWRGVIAPKGLPEDRRLILESALHKAAQMEIVKKRFREFGEEVVISSGKEFEELVRSEYKTFAVVADGMDVRKK